MNIRLATKHDLKGMKEVIETTDLFPSEMLDDMMSDYFENNISEDKWFIAQELNQVIGVAYCAPEKLTDKTYNLYLIAIHSKYKGQGIGNNLLSSVESEVKSLKGRIMLIDTSILLEYQSSRIFYEKNGYQHISTIKDYYKDDEDKITYWKRLN